jgi:hypothetical protein
MSADITVLRAVGLALAALASCACGMDGGLTAPSLFPPGKTSPEFGPLCGIALRDTVKGAITPSAVATVTTLTGMGCFDPWSGPESVTQVRWRVVAPAFPSPAEFDFAVYETLADLQADRRLPYGSLSRYMRMLNKAYTGPACVQARSADGSVREYIALAGFPPDLCNGGVR